MIWFLVLHIAALLVWAGSLLYLPALIAATLAGTSELSEPRREHDSIARFFFTHVATPAALVAIVAGTALFLLTRNTEVWLIIKLTLVTGLVVCHALGGLLVSRAEAASDGRWLRRFCWVLQVITSLLLAAILWIVLAKPALAGIS